jgi:hypothetical protein
MNKELAEKTCLVMQMASCLVDNHLRNLQNVLDKDEFRQYAQKTGKIMGEIYIEVLRPLWANYPELLPKQMEGEYVVNEQIYQDILAVLNKYAAIDS